MMESNRKQKPQGGYWTSTARHFEGAYGLRKSTLTAAVRLLLGVHSLGMDIKLVVVRLAFKL